MRRVPNRPTHEPATPLRSSEFRKRTPAMSRKSACSQFRSNWLRHKEAGHPDHGFFEESWIRTEPSPPGGFARRCLVRNVSHPRLAGRLFDHYRVEVHPKLTSAKKPAHGQNEVRFVYFARRLGRAFGSKPDTTDLAQHCPLPGAGLVKPKCGASQVT